MFGVVSFLLIIGKGVAYSSSVAFFLVNQLLTLSFSHGRQEAAEVEQLHPKMQGQQCYPSHL